LRLQAALGWSLMQIKGSVSETRRAWSKVLELAENLNDEEYQLRAIWGLWVFHFNGGELRTALTMARDAYELAAKRGDPDDMIVGDRMAGSSHHYLGDQVGARVHMERVLNYYVAPHRRSRDIRFVFNPRTSARSYLARILWLQGFPNQAIRTSQTAIEDAEATKHALSICNVLVQAACPIAFWIGDLEAGGRYVTRLLDCSQQHDLIAWHKWGCCYEGILHLQRGDTAKGLDLLGAALGELPGIGYAVYRTAFLGAFAEALAKAGQPGQGLAAIEEAIERSNDAEEHWCLAELLRIKGEVLLRHGMARSASDAEENFRESLLCARRQQTPSWELRTGTLLARHFCNQNRPGEARNALAPVYARFTEGFDTADLTAAKQLLEHLADRP